MTKTENTENKAERKVKERRTPEGIRLYTLRRDAHMTQQEAAQKWGISAQALNRYELGYELMRSSIAVHIARVEGVSLDWLFALSEVKTRA